MPILAKNRRGLRVVAIGCPPAGLIAAITLDPALLEATWQSLRPVRLEVAREIRTVR